MANDNLYVMAVSGLYGYHATKTGPKCTLVWTASCFVIPSSIKCRYLGTWDKISDDLNRLDYETESDHVMPRMLTHAELHSENPDTQSYRVSPEPIAYCDNEGCGTYNEDEQDFCDPTDDYLAEYADLLASKDEEEETFKPQTKSKQNHNENRSDTDKGYARRKSLSDISTRAGMSMSLSLPKERTVDDMQAHVKSPDSKRPKAEKVDFKSITAMARRMSIPILDKSEDVDHGTKIYAETIVKKSKSTKQFREAFSEENDDYIPHRHAKTLTHSMTEGEIENVCEELKAETPGTFKNIVKELHLRGQDFNEKRRPRNLDDDEDNGPHQPGLLRASEVVKTGEDYSPQSQSQLKSVLHELRNRADDKSESVCEIDTSFTRNHTDHSYGRMLHTERPNTLYKSKETKSYSLPGYGQSHRDANRPNYRSLQRSHDRNPNVLRDDNFSKTLPVDFDRNSSGSSTPRSNKSDSSLRTKHLKQSDDQPVSDLMKKLNNLTAQTRLATRPSLGNVDGYEPSSTSTNRSLSVSNAASPLSPKYDRNPLSNSFSSSASSLSDIQSISYHDVTDPCYRCWKTVYSLDKIGPIRRVLYHKQCFRCAQCNTMLSLNTYKQNINDKSDVQVYCKKHVPTQESPHIGLEAKNIDVLMHHPKLDHVNQNIRGTEEDRRKSQNLHPLLIGRAVSTPRLDLICSPNENSSPESTMDKIGNVSLRELKTDERPKSVWSRSSFSAAKLDLGVPSNGRKGSSLYRTADTWNYL